MLKVHKFRKTIVLTSEHLKAEFDSAEPWYGWQIGPNNEYRQHASWVTLVWRELCVSDSPWRKYIDEAGYIVAQDEDEAVVFMSALEQMLEGKYENICSDNRTYNC